MQTNLKLIPTKNPQRFQVQLNLNFQTRYIGKLDISGEGTFLTNRKQKHVFRKLNALGINSELLHDSNIPFKYIRISFTDESGIKKNLETTREYFLRKGTTFQFGLKGFELQIFLPICEFGINKAIQLEKQLGVQENLFHQS